jgi:hypothetical protein
LLEVGEKYPPAEDSARISKENYYEKLLLNKPSGTYDYVDVNGKITKIPRDPLVPIPQTISDISADLLMGEFPGIIFEGQEKIQKDFEDWAFDTDLGSRMLEAATYVSAIGTVFCSMVKVDEEIVQTLKPGNKVTWTEQFGKIENVKFILGIEQEDNKGVIAYDIQEWSLTETGQLLIERYIARVNISNGKVKDVQILEEPQMPGLDFIPISKWVNVGVMGQPNGRSDYSGKSQLFSEIDNRVDQNNSTIEENQDPWKAVPAGVLDESGQLNRSNFSAKMFEKTMGGQADNKVDIMAWDANMPAAFQQIDTMIDMTFFTSRLSNPITGRKTTGTDSGRSLKWQSISTIAQKQRKEKYAASFIRNFINHWSKLAGKEVEKKDIKIKWQDGLPIDEQEKTETIVAQHTAGLMSTETAVAQLQELNDDEAKKEIARINADKAQAAELEAQSVSPIVV